MHVSPCAQIFCDQLGWRLSSASRLRSLARDQDRPVQIGLRITVEPTKALIGSSIIVANKHVRQRYTSSDNGLKAGERQFHWCQQYLFKSAPLNLLKFSKKPNLKYQKILSLFKILKVYKQLAIISKTIFVRKWFKFNNQNIQLYLFISESKIQDIYI